MDDSAITCNEITDADTAAKSNDKTKGKNKETKTLNEKEITYKTEKFYILLTFLLIIIALLIAVSIYCYLITY